MPCIIHLRHDQTLSQRSLYSSNKVSVFAPSWVREGLKVLGELLEGVVFHLFDNTPGPSRSSQIDGSKPAETFLITEEFNGQSLILLQKIARNERHNVSGIIGTSQYPDVEDKKVLYSLRDLVRQCVIVGVDYSSRCGGYNCKEEAQEKQKVYICDLAALQFQQPYNSGRLVLVHETDELKGVLDDLIYEHVVGEKKASYNDIYVDWMKGDQHTRRRYLLHNFNHFGQERKTCFIDTKAYKKFVALDVVLSTVALSEIASAEGDLLHFKFLKYGTGFFAARFQSEIEKLILPGVLDGLEQAFSGKYPKVSATIKSVELPFYKNDPSCSKRIDSILEKHGVEITFSKCDALKRTCPAEEGSDGRKIVLATTNCGDNHVVCGNEMGFSSVDAAIAENLESKGNLFAPNINLLMKEHYLDI